MDNIAGAKYIVETSTKIVWSEIPRAIGVTTLMWLHLVTLGYWGARAIGYKTAKFWAGVSVGAGMGFALLGGEMVLLGYIHALSVGWLLFSSLIMLAAFVPLIHRFLVWWFRARRELWMVIREDRIIAFACGFVLLMLAIAALRPPREVDEREYHWAAPLMWADNGHWVGTPFHNTNGPALGEIVYTFCAIFKTPIAAHWTHLGGLLILLAGCCALAEEIGGCKIAALGVCLSVPVIVNQACISYTDVAAAALVVGAYVALLCNDGHLLGSTPMRGRILAASLLFMGAVSVKSNTLAALPMAAFLVFWVSLPEGKKLFTHKVLVVGRPALLCIPVFGTLCLWMVHTYVLTGDWKARQKEIERMTSYSPSDPKWHTGEAVARVPTVKDLVELPFLPAIMPVLGQSEPFGGRTGLLLYLAPIGIFSMGHLTAMQRRKALWLLTCAVIYFLSLGAIALKTRYHIFVWVTGACFASIAYHLFRNAKVPLKRQLGLGAYYLLMFVGIADIAHVVLRGLTRF